MKLPFEKPKKKIKKSKRKKLHKLSVLKREAWKWFSLWVRKRETISAAICVTCGSFDYPEKMNAGHFIHGHSKPTFFDERNVHIQCVRCNLYLSGNLVEYAVYMQKRYGWETVNELRELSHQVIKFDRNYYEGIILKYKRLVESLDAPKTQVEVI